MHSPKVTVRFPADHLFVKVLLSGLNMKTMSHVNNHCLVMNKLSPWNEIIIRIGH